MNIVANAFSLQMLSLESEKSIKVTPVSGLLEGELKEIILSFKGQNPLATSAVGHQDTAAVLGVPCARINVSLKEGDRLWVAQIVGGRLPEGSTTLPEGFKIKWVLVELD